VLQCFAVCCSVLQRVAVRRCVAACRGATLVLMHCSALQCVVVRCSALQCVAARNTCCSSLPIRCSSRAARALSARTVALLALSWKKFSKVSSILNLLYQMTIELAFENLCRALSARTVATHCNALQHTAPLRSGHFPERNSQKSAIQ